MLGSFSFVSDALAALEGCRPIAAVLNVELYDGSTFALAKQLSDAGTPVVFSTARVDLLEEAGFGDAPRLGRPFLRSEIAKILSQVLTTDRSF